MNTIKVELRFVGDNVVPQRINEVLRLEPSSARLKGEAVENRPGKYYHTGVWRMASTIPPTETLDRHIQELLGQIEPHLDDWQQLLKEGYRPNFYCGLFLMTPDSYIRLEPTTVLRLARLEASLDIHVYDIKEESEKDEEG